ncbi:MAG: FAD-dependent oxidoreductase [Deltaproteobacteria bacterium]|nr:FAD-dependent oxidoreductase [Deltaproteobacteria bacterium]
MIGGGENKEPFSKIKPRMTEQEAVVEASRCLFCHDAPCVQACPTDINIPLFIRQIMSRNPNGSAKTIFTQNILGRSCADVCPTEVLCEGSCVYLGMNKKPIEIGRLQGFATNQAIGNKICFFNRGEATGKRIAVIGGGPAGLACAHELTVLGHEAVVFEANEKPGGLNRYGVAPYKYSNAESDEEVAYLSEIGFEIRTGVRIGTDISLEELEERFHAIFLGVGLGSSKKLGIAGEELGGVFGAAEFIHHLREKEQKMTVGKNVVVVGGGNTAIDAAVESAKLGAHVTLVYRRTENKMSAYDFEVNWARQNGVAFVFETSPVEILGEKKVSAIRFKKSPPFEKGGSGGIFTIECDQIIFATGQEKNVPFLKQIDGIRLEEGKIRVNDDFQTENQKYFAGGDCVNGGKEVVNAVAHGRDAARGIDRYFKRTSL